MEDTTIVVIDDGQHRKERQSDGTVKVVPIKKEKAGKKPAPKGDGVAL